MFETRLHSKYWRWFFVFLAIIGIAISVYALNHHLQLKIFGRTDAMCNLNSYFNCDRVAKSRFSEIHGIPLALLGIGYFSAIAIVVLWNFNVQGYFLLVVLGFLTSIVLSLISAFGVKALCVTCLSFYSVNLIQAISLFFFWRITREPLWGRRSITGLVVCGVVVALWITGFMLLEKKVTYLLSEPRYSSDMYHYFSKVMGVKPKVVTYDIEGKNGVPDIWRGKKDSKVVIVEYYDVMCPSCQDFQPFLDRVFKDYGDRVLFVVKNFPRATRCNPHARTKLHEWACEAALLGECAWEKGKFWEYQNYMFSNAGQTPLTATPGAPRDTRPRHEQALSKLGFTDAEIKKCLESKVYLGKIMSDVEEGWKLGVRATPGVYINGWRFTDINSYDFLKYEVELRLRVE